MKLKKSIYKTTNIVNFKFLNMEPRFLKKGDYISLSFVAPNQKRRGGGNLRIHKQTVMLFKQRRRGVSLSFIVTALYRKEKVFWRYLISSPYLLHVSLVQKTKCGSFKN